jgi:polar amino acid transport system permease protein
MDMFVENFANLDSLLLIYPLLLQGLKLTFLLSIATLPLAALAGLLLAVLYSFDVRGLRAAVLVYIDVCRSFPVVVLLVLIYFGLPFLGWQISGFSAAVLAMVINHSGYFGEIFRTGVRSVPPGQYEAARALGFRPLRLAVMIVLPQAIRNVLAPLAGNSLELIKTTSIAAMVALPELLRSARVAQEQTYNPTPLMAAAVIFFVLLWPFTRWVARLERRMLVAR